jgi:HEAT repeat protein
VIEQKRILRIVVASPSDVQAERDTLPAVIDELNRGIAAERSLLLELHRWETDAYPGFHSKGPQGLIDPILKVKDCDILIGIFWKRFGTPTKEARSGTEHEILDAYKAWQQNRKPQIMVYFNEKVYTPKSKEETDQWGQVLAFKERFPEEGLWWAYKGKTQFERLVRNHLTQFIRNQYPRPPKAQDGAEQDSPCRSTDELAQEYLLGLAERVNKVYIFGEEEPRVLDKVFVDLNIVEEYRRPIVHAEFLGLMDAEMRQRRSAFARAKDERGLGTASSKIKRTMKPDELLRVRTQAVVTGAPGCGKTTLLRYLAWQTHEMRERLPIFLELKAVTSDAFDRTQHDLAELLFDETMAGPLRLYGAERERFRESFLARLAAGEAAIFLDGLDEVSGTDFFPQLCEAVSEFVRRTHRNNILVISTRPYALQARLEGLKQMEIAPLNQRQIEEFFAHYYSNDSEAQRLLRTLRQRRPLRDLLRVPFLLTVVTQLYRQQHHIVEDRLELYRQLVWHLVVQLDREKRLDRRDFRIPDRNGALKLDFLKYLACERLLIDDVRAEAEGREAARLIFTGDVILDKAKLFWKSAGHTTGNPYDLANDVKATPLLREVGSDVYAFTHLTIQEYLAAFALSQRDDCEAVFCRVYFNPTLAGMEVLPMTLGLARKPEKLYSALEQLPESLTFSNLRLRVRCLAYVLSPDRQLLTRLVARLLEFVNEHNFEEIIYTEILLRDFAEARTQSLNFIVEHVAALLQSDDSKVRGRAAEALGGIGGEHAVDILLSVLQRDAVSNVRWRAAKALGEIGDECAVDELLSVLLRDSVSFVRGITAEALGQIGNERAVPALIPLLKDTDNVVRWRAAEALGHLGDERAVDALLDLLLKDTDNLSGGGAVKALSWIGGKRVVEALLNVLLKDADSLARGRAIEVLDRLSDERAVPALIPLLKDTDNVVRGHAAAALSRIGDKRDTDALIPLLKDAVGFANRRAVEALGEIGSEQALNALLDVLLKDVVGFIREYAAAALSRIGGKRAVDALLPKLKSTLSFVREPAAVALGHLGDERAVPILLQMLKDDSHMTRGDAVEALGHLSDERAVPALLLLLKDKYRFLRERAAVVLGKIDDSALVVGLVHSLSHEDEFVRLKAALIVGYYSEGEEVLQELMRMADEDISETVRLTASEARDRYERKLAYFS